MTRERENRFGRREFLERSTGLIAGMALATPSYGAHQKASPGEKVILGQIGCGGRGSMVCQSIAKLPNVEFAYVCDPEDARANALQAALEKDTGRKPVAVREMRTLFDDKNVDAVVISTPEQWHALASIWACQAGKDVYVEKNVTLGIWEGRKMIDAARKYNRILQVGTQNRSAPYNMAAREYIQSGKLGKVQLVKVFNLQGGSRWTPKPDTPSPAGLDWDLWLGPAPSRPYNAGHHRSWGDYWAYCGGTLSGDGSHQLDLARMVLGDPGHPKAITFAGGRYLYDDHQEMPDTMVISYEFDNMVMTMENGNFTPYMDKIAMDIRESLTEYPYWPQCATRIEIYGTEGLMYLGRHGGGWQVFGKAKTQSRPAPLIAQGNGMFPDRDHQPNFLDCVRTRKRPTADIEIAHPSACLVHFGNIAYRTKHNRLVFDASTETFVGDKESNALLKPHYRKGYTVPESV